MNKPRYHYLYGGEQDILALATTLLFGIARNHAFEQGNKRAGFIAAVMFLEMNGYMLTVADTELFGELVLQVINGEISEASFTKTMQIFIAELADYVAD